MHQRVWLTAGSRTLEVWQTQQSIPNAHSTPDVYLQEQYATGDSPDLLIRAIVHTLLIGNAGFHCLTPHPVRHSNEETTYIHVRFSVLGSGRSQGHKSIPWFERYRVSAPEPLPASITLAPPAISR